MLADLTYTFLNDSCSSEEENPWWLEVFANISITITTFFLVEIPLTLWSLGPSYYNPFKVPHASLHLFDALIVIVTFVLEFVLKGRERELAGLLIILRLWRLVKLVGGALYHSRADITADGNSNDFHAGIAVGAGEIDEELSKTLREVQQELDEKSQELARIKEENRQLKLGLTAVDATGD